MSEGRAHDRVMVATSCDVVILPWSTRQALLAQMRRIDAARSVIARHVPQLEILKQATVCITHAGLNTVLESLAQGVPQVAVPVTYDQPGVAARIAHHKTGLVSSLDKLTPNHLAFLLSQVLIDPTYRENSHKLQQAIAEANGLSVAADLIEESLGVSKGVSGYEKHIENV